MSKPWIQIGRYVLCDELARGGMATVHLGRLTGAAGFARTVAIKRLHPHLATDPSFVAMLLDEARLAARIQHPNVAATMDVVSQDGELFVVMEYLHGETLARLLRAAIARGERVPPNIAVAIAVGALGGLHAAHEARSEEGEPLGLVHRDVSPQNIMVRRDGTAVVVDFGVAKAAGRFHVTQEGQIKGKLPYMASEQVRGQTLTRRVDVYAASAVLWETLVGQRLAKGTNEAEVLEKLLFEAFPAPGSLVEGIPPALDAVVMKGLSRLADDRWQTAREMALALEDALAPATPSRVAAWMEDLVGDVLSEREKRLAALESGRSSQLPAARAEDVVKRVVADEGAAATRPADESVTLPKPAVAPDPRGDAAARVTVPDRTEGDPAAQPEAVQAISKISQVVSIDIDGSPRSGSPPLDAPAPRRSRAALGALVAVPIAGIVAVVALTRGSPSHGEAAPAAPPVASASAAPPEPSATSTSADVAPPPAPASASPEASAMPSTQAARPAPHLSPGAVKGAKAAAKAGCAVPYTIDATGRRIYKRECL